MNKQCTKCKKVRKLHDFYKHKLGCHGLQPRCKQCCTIETGRVRKNNAQHYKRYYANWLKRQGYCAYEAIFPEGKYIGSGQVPHRKCRHLKGTSGIALKLESKAIEFNIILKGTKEKCQELEAFLIDEIGLENLLNENKVHKSAMEQTD